MLYREDVETLDAMQSLAMKDIKCVVDKGQILPTDYPNLEKAVNIVHYINEIYKDNATTEAMEDYGGTEYEVSSRAMPHMRSYGPNVHLPMDDYSANPYRDGSYERGRSARTGRYVSRDNDVRARLQDEMSKTSDPQERQALQRVIDRM